MSSKLRAVRRNVHPSFDVNVQYRPFNRYGRKLRNAARRALSLSRWHPLALAEPGRENLGPKQATADPPEGGAHEPGARNAELVEVARGAAAGVRDRAGSIPG